MLKFFCSFVSRMFVIVHWSLFMSQSKSLSDNFNIINILVVVSVDFLYSFMLGFPCSILTLIYNFVLNLLDIVLWHSGSYFCFSKSPLTLWEGEGRYRLIITRWRRKSNSLAILHCHPSVEGHFIAGWEWNFRSPCLSAHTIPVVGKGMLHYHLEGVEVQSYHVFFTDRRLLTPGRIASLGSPLGLLWYHPTGSVRGCYVCWREGCLEFFLWCESGIGQ